MRYSDNFEIDLDKIVITSDESKVYIRKGYTKLLLFLKREKISYSKIKGIHAEGYSLAINDFIPKYILFIKSINEDIIKWNKMHVLLKLIEYIRNTFESNLKAHNSDDFTKKRQYYDRKNHFLFKSITLASNIKSELLKFGKKIDSNCKNYENIILFQINQAQVSFHTNQVWDIREFPLVWDGCRKEEFPITIKECKDLIKNNKIENLNLDTLNPIKENNEYITSIIMQKRELFEKLKIIRKSKETNGKSKGNKLNNQIRYKKLESYFPSIPKIKD